MREIDPRTLDSEPTPPVQPKPRVETKVSVTSGAAALVTVLMYLLSQVPAVASMPDTVRMAAQTLLVWLVTVAVGYFAPHTPR